MDQKVKEIMAKIFDTDVTCINDETSIDNLENWDSLRHMYLVLALEEEFEIEFPHEQITEMLSYKIVLLTLQELLQDQTH